MSHRDKLRHELRYIIRDALPGTFDIADAILAAGWRPPARVVSTAGERLELLMRVSETAEPAHVRDRWRRHWLITEDDGGRFWAWGWREEGEAALRPVDAEELAMPLTVLHEGGDAR